MLTVGDALISISYGVLLFGEHLRLGWFLVPEIVALVLIVVGYIEIAKSPVATAHDEGVQPSPPVTVAEPAGVRADARAAMRRRPARPAATPHGRAGRDDASSRPDGHWRTRAEAEGPYS